MYPRFHCQNSVLKDKLDHNLAQDFARFKLFYPEHFSRRVQIKCLPGIKTIRVGRASEFRIRAGDEFLNNHRMHRFSEQLCSEHHENLGRAQINRGKNDVALATNGTDAILKLR
jgi:hypothetical protein